MSHEVAVLEHSDELPRDGGDLGSRASDSREPQRALSATLDDVRLTDCRNRKRYEPFRRINAHDGRVGDRVGAVPGIHDRDTVLWPAPH